MAMKKAFFCIYFLFFLLPMASAQRLTLDDAIKLALENRWELKNQQLQIRLAEGENDKLRAKWLPQINASADMRWNTQLQTSVFKNAPFVIFFVIEKGINCAFTLLLFNQLLMASSSAS